MPGPTDMSAVDVLVLLDPAAPLDAPVEAFIQATCERQLPPEAWALRANGEDPLARHYLTDVRVTFRTLLVPEAAPDAPAAQCAARHALFWIRRDAHFVALGSFVGLSALRRFRHTEPVEPEDSQVVRHRLELDAVRAADARSAP